MKTSKAYFNRFKKAFLYWQEKLGLTQYRITFFHESLDGEYASIAVAEQEKLANVRLNTIAIECDDGPENHAKHEVIHLLIHRLKWLGEQRFTGSDEMHDEAEAVTVRLEKVLK